MEFFNNIGKSILAFAQPEIKENWEFVMLADRRDWNRIYRDYRSILSEYIGKVRVLALSNNISALSELSVLEQVFQWDEKFLVDWVIQVDDFTHTVEYDSFEEMNDALLGNSYPEEDARDVWEEHCGTNTCYWSYAYNPEIIIDNLRMKQ